MTEQLSIFSRYPLEPGYKKPGTSSEAANSMKPRAKALRVKVLEVLGRGACTADECAKKLQVSILAIRPRCSELMAQGLIERTGARRPNDSGLMADVLRAK